MEDIFLDKENKRLEVLKDIMINNFDSNISDMFFKYSEGDHYHKFVFVIRLKKVISVLDENDIFYSIIHYLKYIGSDFTNIGFFFDCDYDED